MSPNDPEPLIDCRVLPHDLDVVARRLDLPRLPSCGGYVSFEGHIRDHNHGRVVTRLYYEAYEPLATRELTRIAVAAARDHGLHAVRCWHRTGELTPLEPAVIVQVLAPHRAEAFAGCRQVIDELKTRAPIWKKEFYADGDSAWTRCRDHQHEARAHGEAAVGATP